MEAAGLIEKIEQPRPLRFNFEDVHKLPPPILAFNDVAFSYSGKSEDYLYKNLSFGIEYVIPPFFLYKVGSYQPRGQHGIPCCYRWSKRYRKVDIA